VHAVKCFLLFSYANDLVGDSEKQEKEEKRTKESQVAQLAVKTQVCLLLFYGGLFEAAM
jgi:hypothetical protein